MSADLRDRLDEAQETIRLLNEQLCPQALWMWMPPEWKLTAGEAKMVAMLAARAPALVTREALHWHCVPSAQSDDPADIKVIDVLISKTRSKLKDTGIVIDTLWGQGYGLSRQDAELVMLICDAEKRGDRVTTATVVARVPHADGPWLECFGAITSRDHLEDVIKELRRACEEAWPYRTEERRTA